MSVTRAQRDAVIEVRNTGTATHSVVGSANGGGRGLVNMRERALLEGGSLESGPVADGFVVRASLPLQEKQP